MEEFNVLVVGNNPIEMSTLFQRLGEVVGKKIITRAAFDVKSIADRLDGFKPQYVLIDDNLGIGEMTLAIDGLKRNRQTRHAPITVLKNSNYESTVSTGILNYVLKESSSGDNLYHAFLHSIKFRRTQLLMAKAYRNRKRKIKDLFKGN